MKRYKFRHRSIAWDILCIAIIFFTSLSLGLSHYPFDRLALGFSAGCALIILALRTRKPHLIYWSLQGFIWLTGIGAFYTVIFTFGMNPQSPYELLLFLTFGISLVLAFLYYPCILLLKKVFIKPIPKQITETELVMQNQYNSSNALFIRPFDKEKRSH